MYSVYACSHHKSEKKTYSVCPNLIFSGLLGGYIAKGSYSSAVDEAHIC